MDTDSMLRHESWHRPTGVSPVPVGAAAPGSRPQSRRETSAAERGFESLFGGSERAGCDCSLVTFTTEEPSRSCHGEGHAHQSRCGSHGGSSRGRGSCTRARPMSERGRPVRPAQSGEERADKPMVKRRGGRRESEGAVVVWIGVQNNAPGAKGPCFDRGCGGGKR
jgi:hypothetical protein